MGGSSWWEEGVVITYREIFLVGLAKLRLQCLAQARCWSDVTFRGALVHKAETMAQTRGKKR